MIDISRELAMIKSTHDVTVTITHTPGTTLEDTADALSRCHLGEVFRARVNILTLSGVTLEKPENILWQPPPTYFSPI